MHMYVEIDIEATQFLFWEYINWIFVAIRYTGIVEVIFQFFMWAAKHLYRVSLVFLLLVVGWGGADIPEGGAVQEDQELNEVSFGHWYI